MRCMVACDECYRRVAVFAELDTIGRRGSRKWYQPWDRTDGCDDRHANPPSGGVPPWPDLLFHRYDHLCRDDVACVPRIDPLSQLAPNYYEVSTPSTRSRRDLFV